MVLGSLPGSSARAASTLSSRPSTQPWNDCLHVLRRQEGGNSTRGQEKRERCIQNWCVSLGQVVEIIPTRKRHCTVGDTCRVPVALRPFSANSFSVLSSCFSEPWFLGTPPGPSEALTNIFQVEGTKLRSRCEQKHPLSPLAHWPCVFGVCIHIFKSSIFVLSKQPKYISELINCSQLFTKPNQESVCA